MELQYFGANCLVINTKEARLVVDDNLASIGLKTVTKSDDIVLRTSKLTSHSPAGRFTIDSPGEYEISGVSINGIAARAHMDKDDQKNAVVYIIETAELRLAVVGHIFHQLKDEQLEAIDGVDIAVVPVGNTGYTLDGTGALQIIKQIEPKVVIPTHYADKAIKYEVPQVELAESLKAMGMEPAQTVDKYKPKPQELTDTTQLIVLERR